ncbi:MAG TPA: UxaA family hydrolase, partial [Parafilimonas sp.]
MQTKVLKIHKNDNVAVALSVLYKEDKVSSENFNEVELKENIPAKHKFALQDFNEGDAIIMYGVLVGKATKFIPQGALISTQNIQHAANSFSLKERHTNWHKPDVSKFKNKTFNGFHRAD